MRRALALGTIATTMVLAVLAMGPTASAARNSALPDGFLAQSQSWISPSQASAQLPPLPVNNEEDLYELEDILNSKVK